MHMNIDLNEMEKIQLKEYGSEKNLKNTLVRRRSMTRKCMNQNYEKLNKYDKELLSQMDGQSIMINFTQDINNLHLNLQNSIPHLGKQQTALNQNANTQYKRQPVQENQIVELEKKVKKTEANLHRLYSEISSDETFKQMTEKGASYNESGLFSNLRRQEEEAILHYKTLPISVQKKYEEFCCRIANEGKQDLNKCKSQELMECIPPLSPRSPSPKPPEDSIYSALDDVPPSRHVHFHRALSPSTLSSASYDSDDPCDVHSFSESLVSLNSSNDSLHFLGESSHTQKSSFQLHDRIGTPNAMKAARASLNGLLLQYCDEQEITENLTNSLLHEFTTGQGVKNIINGARTQDKVASRGLLICVTDMQKLRTEINAVRKATRKISQPAFCDEPLRQEKTEEMSLMEYVQGNPYAVQDDAMSKVNMLQQAKSDLLDIFKKSRLDPKFLKKLAEPPRWNT